jgi:hypothetical protein
MSSAELTNIVVENATDPVKPAPINVQEICKQEINMGVTQDQRTLIYKRNFLFGGNDSILFPVTTYDQIKRLFDEIARADNHMITLKQSAATN